MYAAIVTLNTQVQRVAEVSGRRQDIMVEHSSRWHIRTAAAWRFSYFSVIDKLKKHNVFKRVWMNCSWHPEHIAMHIVEASGENLF